MPAERSSFADPLVATREELELLRRQFAADSEARKTEFERFREETIWRLNAMSDRTIDIACMEEENVKRRLVEERKKIDIRIAEWKKVLYERVHDEKFVNSVAMEAMKRLLPGPGGGESP